MDGFQMSVPLFMAQATVSIWTAQDIQPKRVLEQVWVHVQGVPYTIRHFLGLWAVGSLIGTTLDVDLVTLRSQNIVRILVGMIDSSVLEKRVDEKGPYIGAACVIKLGEYDFFFRRESTDFIVDPSFVPFFWRRKGDDPDPDAAGNAKGPSGSMDQASAPGGSGSQSSNMEVDANVSSGAPVAGHSAAPLAV